MQKLPAKERTTCAPVPIVGYGADIPSPEQPALRVEAQFAPQERTHKSSDRKIALPEDLARFCHVFVMDMKPTRERVGEERL